MDISVTIYDNGMNFLLCALKVLPEGSFLRFLIYFLVFILCQKTGNIFHFFAI